MAKKTTYTIRKHSQIPFAASMITLFGAVLLIFMYWPIYVQYFFPGRYEGPATTGLMVIFYSVLIAGTLGFSLTAGTLAKKSAAFSALFAMPVSLFYFLDIIGLRQTILFFDLDNVFWFYRENADYLSAAWPFVVLLGILTIAACAANISLTFQKTKSHMACVMIMGATALLWFVYTVYRITAVDYPLFAASTASTRDFLYSMAAQAATTLFFWAQFLLAAALRPAESAKAEPIIDAAPSGGEAVDVIAAMVTEEDDSVSYSRDAADLPDHLEPLSEIEMADVDSSLTKADTDVSYRSDVAELQDLLDSQLEIDETAEIETAGIDMHEAAALEAIDETEQMLEIVEADVVLAPVPLKQEKRKKWLGIFSALKAQPATIPESGPALQAQPAENAELEQAEKPAQPAASDETPTAEQTASTVQPKLDKKQTKTKKTTNRAKQKQPEQTTPEPSASGEAAAEEQTASSIQPQPDKKQANAKKTTQKAKQKPPEQTKSGDSSATGEAPAEEQMASTVQPQPGIKQAKAKKTAQKAKQKQPNQAAPEQPASSNEAPAADEADSTAQEDL